MPTSHKTILPQIGITTGDPAGIGPEVSLLAAQDKSFPGNCRLILFGDWDMLKSRAAAAGIPFEFDRIPSDVLGEKEHLPDRAIVHITAGNVQPGSGSKATGEAAARNIIECSIACSRGHLDAMATAPISKKFLQEAGYIFPGHTEFLANLTGAPEVAMAFLSERLKVVLATIHLPLRVAVDCITTELILGKLRIIMREFTRLGIACSRVAVAGVNPHAGESGLLGTEDIDSVEPAVQQARHLYPNITIEGPLPADTLFWRALHGEFDVVLAMFHDQGLAPIKMVGFGEAVNVTLGLPFIRTSVDHGTAFDIAGKGVAKPDSMITAIKWALRLIQRHAN